MRKILFALPVMATLAACATTQPATKIETVTVIKEVQKPCAVEKPARPAPTGALPTNLEALAATLGAKLKEYVAPGGWADKAEAAIDECITPD